MFKRPCLLYFPRAVVNAIPSSNIRLPFRFPGRLQGKVWMTTRPWFVLPCLGDDRASIRLKVHQCAEHEQRVLLVFSRVSSRTRGIALKTKEHNNNSHIKEGGISASLTCSTLVATSTYFIQQEHRLIICYIKEILKRSLYIILAKEWL